MYTSVQSPLQCTLCTAQHGISCYTSVAKPAGEILSVEESNNFYSFPELENHDLARYSIFFTFPIARSYIVEEVVVIVARSFLRTVTIVTHKYD